MFKSSIYYRKLIISLFRQRFKKNQPIIQLTEQEQHDQILCHTTMMLTMSTFEDWRTHLSQLLQSVPFPDQALIHKQFIE